MTPCSLCYTPITACHSAAYSVASPIPYHTSCYTPVHMLPLLHA